MLTGTLCLSYNDGGAADMASPMGAARDGRSASIGMGNRRSSLSQLMSGLRQMQSGSRPACNVPAHTRMDDRLSESAGMETL